jgi:hypothetical protein
MEEELKKLPILRIHETDYYVDMSKLEFRQVDDAKNAISFRDVKDHGSHTSVVYDPLTKNVFKGTWTQLGNRPDVLVVRLPSAIELDTQYIADRLQLELRRKYLETRNAREAELKNKKPLADTQKTTAKQKRFRFL